MKLPWDEKQKTMFAGINVIPASQKTGGTDPSLYILDEIAHYNPNMNTNWRQIPRLMREEMKYEVKSYPDGSKYVIVHQATTQMVFKINTYEDLWILNQIHDVVKNAGLKVEVTIPNLIDAQADRRFKTNQPHGLKLVCEFLNSMTNFSFRIFHPHNVEVVEALLDRVKIIDNSEFITKVLHNLTTEKFGEKYDSFQKESFLSKFVLFASDAGGFKPLMKLADNLEWGGETFSASKSRKYVDGHSKLVQQVDRQDFEGKDLLLVDDISVNGGTFKGLAKLLRERNCGKLYLAVSHMTVSDLGEDSVTKYFDRVFTTDSKYERYTIRVDDEIEYPNNLTIISQF